MPDDLVEITIRGKEMPVLVSRRTLAKNIKVGQGVAEYLGKRPGEPTEQFPPNEKLSIELIQTARTVIDAYFKQRS